MRNLIVILGDQLSHKVSALRGSDPAEDVVLMMEVKDEANSIPHHKKKIAFILSAMREFAAELRTKGYVVDYITLDDPENTGNFTGELLRALARRQPECLILTEASEWRVLDMQRQWLETLDIRQELRPDDRFICDLPDFRRWASGRKTFLMEHFYREMRRKTGLLMDGDQPVQGRWNFDAENRKAAKPDLFRMPPCQFKPSPFAIEVLALVDKHFPDRFGDLEPFWLATTAGQAEQALDHFLTHNLPHFGETQDAMLLGDPFLNHCFLSMYINLGLLDPLDVCRKAEGEWRAGRAPIEAVEGFVRQILGWREYVRGIYWLSMPGYLELNHLDAKRPLPAFYWTGQTKMTCLAQAISQTKKHGYAHHIQRLMVTGNFALLAGIDPVEVHHWYLSVYLDAFEWVEAPNTLGMALFADGGIMATKPYAASGAYINKMSDYCSGCYYDPAIKSGPKACPFNPLYWDFIGRNEDVLGRNPRLATAFSTWRKMSDVRKQEIKHDAHHILQRLNDATL